MATCLKRTSKLFNISLLQSSVDISLRELMCPVCRSILIEPVTLPCTHNLCLKCLKGTFEHNSLRCPLCRVRVGSWLRTATKTETLVNNDLWELIRTKFPKEVENKYNGDDKNIELDVGFTSVNKTLCAPGEIRKEYEVQLQMAEEEIHYERKAEQIASEALIRKIQEEEQQQQLVQLTQDQLLAKSLVEKQIVEQHKEASKYCNNYSHAVSNLSHTSKFNVATMTEINTYRMEPHSSKYNNDIALEAHDNSKLGRPNVALLSKIRSERYTSNIKNNDSSNKRNDSMPKFCCQKQMPMYNVITKTLKYQATTKVADSCMSDCPMESGTSASKVYGTQSKEELHVPDDVVNSKKKSLGVEVCISSGDDDERMGSAESAGSHDSINQEIHHFKPIKAMPRTPLKISTDGRQIDPKLIRVVPIFKRMCNVIPKPPSQTHLKRIIGCSWSAFRGKTKQNAKNKEVYKQEIDQKPSTSYDDPRMMSNKIVKSQIQDNIRKFDFTSEISFDSNKNYAKNTNKLMNGNWKSQIRNGMACKSKRQKNLWSKKDTRTKGTTKYMDDTEIRNSTSISIKMNSSYDEQVEVQRENEMTVENIAERIKKRKTDIDKQNSDSMCSLNLESDVVVKRNSRKRLYRNQKLEYKVTDDIPVTIQKRCKTKHVKIALSKSKQQRTRQAKQSSTENFEKNDSSVNLSCQISNFGFSKVTRKARHSNSINSEQDVIDENTDSNNCNSSESCTELHECMLESNETNTMLTIMGTSILSDEEIIKEQKRMERLVIQEKEDFELAQRLQAKFDEMERIAGRTRRSKKAIEDETTELDLYKIDSRRNVQKAINLHTTTPSIATHTVGTETKKRGRPPKRIK